MSLSVAQTTSSLLHLKLSDQLRKAMSEVELLSAEDQDFIAALIMREVAKSPASAEDDASVEESLQTLLQEARQEMHDGKTKLMSKG